MRTGAEAKLAEHSWRSSIRDGEVGRVYEGGVYEVIGYEVVVCEVIILGLDNALADPDLASELHLGLVESKVGALAGEQFVMGTDFDQFAGRDYCDTVRLAQGAESMGDGDGGAALDKCVQRGLNLPFRLGIDG